MPKHFSEDERKLIKQKLLSITKGLIESKGFKATSVDQIVESVGISKGSFYNFYQSKESLVYNIILDIEEQMHIEEITNLNSALSEMEYPAALYCAIWKSLNKLNEEPLLQIINDAELIYKILSNITPHERRRGDYQNQTRVLDFIEIATKQRYKLTIKMSTFNSILMSFFTIYVNQNILGEDGEEAMKAIIKPTIESIFLKIDNK